MARVSLGTSTSDFATAYSTNRKIVKTSTGVLVLFAVIDGDIKYKTSSDNGDTWDVSWVNVETYRTISYGFDICIDTSNNIYVAWASFSDNARLRKLTYSGGTWSIGAERIIADTSYTTDISLLIRPSGELFAVYNYGYSGAWRFYGAYSTDDGATWNRSYVTEAAATVNAVFVTIKGTTVWGYEQCNAKITYRIWDDGANTWGVANDIAASGITNSHYSLGGLRISDSEIYIAGRTASGIKVYKYDGATWDAGTLLTATSSDRDPSLSNVNNKPVLSYVVYQDTHFDIAYRKWNGASWDAKVDLTTDADTDLYPSGILFDEDYLYICYTTSPSPYDIYFDKVRLVPFTQTILSDAKIKVFDIQQNLTSDALIAPFRKDILSDAKIKALDVPQTILSDSKVVDQYQETILSDAKIIIFGEQKTILSDAKICIPVLVDIINKINTVKQVLSNIINKVNTVILVLSDVNNFVNTCKGVIADVANDFRTKKLSTLNDVANDIRFMYSWQKAADNTLQSLGKEYIKVYIGGAEQTDVDVDSINISKDVSTAHSASFDLGRPYDATKPIMESTVLIKYHIWTLFSGYITHISPLAGPEKMRIDCRDEYWKQNKTNVYYHVGHTPADDKELYYETLASALTIEHGWTPGIGNFCPETIDNFAVGKSDAITTLIEECGNDGWFYDVDGSKKLWVAGEGSIIELERQTLGENIKLYDVINHSFDESVEDIVNKFRVQMGNKVIRKLDTTGGSRTYTGYNYSSYHQFVTPAWDRSLELLSKQTGSGYGFDHQNPAWSADYSLVFKKYNMPYLNPELSSWSDRYPPYVEIYNVGGAFGFVGPLNLSVEKVLTEGFTIDYEKQTITFSEPYYLYQTNANGECTSIRAPIVKVFLWKKNYYTYTLDPTDNPETDISNPLMFFTAKMGTYADTIIKDLNLSNLSIQVGGMRGTDFIPSWDDTAFATDKANWELSKNCDKKIRGTIEITLDAMCYYNIDLTKRIYIAGITDEPMNITGISYNMSNFTVNLTLENKRYYNRTVSFQSHGE